MAEGEVGPMRMKRTRPIRGKYFLTVPRIRIEDAIYEIKLKVSQVVVTKVKDVPPVGEIERGSVDGEEEE